MVAVSFIVTNPSASFSDQKYGFEGWGISFRAELSNSFRQHVELSSQEEELKNLDGVIRFFDRNPDKTEHQKKGTIFYWKGSDDNVFPDPPGYTVTIFLEKSDYENINRTIGDGLPLYTVRIDVEGMKYGWEPDGSGKKWDNINNPTLEIEGYTLFFGEPEEEEIVPDPPEPKVDTLPKLLAEVRAVNSKTTYALILGASAIILSILY